MDSVTNLQVMYLHTLNMVSPPAPHTHITTSSHHHILILNSTTKIIVESCKWARWALCNCSVEQDKNKCTHIGSLLYKHFLTLDNQSLTMEAPKVHAETHIVTNSKYSTMLW